MATGRSTQLTRQIGEHLIAAKLGRLGYIATPFAGNVPDFDLLIADEKGYSIPVQVKAINGGSWQFNISKFLDVEIIDDIQYVRGKQKLGNPNLVCVFVQLADDEKDDFYLYIGRMIRRKGILTAETVCRHLNKELIIVGQGAEVINGNLVPVENPDFVLAIILFPQF